MKIEFSEEQYHTLLKVFYWSEWILNSYKTEIDSEGKAVQQLEQLIFSHYKDGGAEGLVEYDEESKSYFPTADFEEEAHARLDEYEEYILARDKFN